MLVAFGVAVALAALVRGQALVLLPCAIIVWAIAPHPRPLSASREASRIGWRSALGWGALAALVACAAIAPWTLRNWSVLGSPVVLSTKTGPNFWIGHHDGATGRMSTNGELAPLTERGDRTLPEWEAANDRLALREGLDYALTHPLEEIVLAGAKVRALYEADSVALDWNSAYQRNTLYASPEFEDVLRATANGFWFTMIVLSGVGMLIIARGTSPPAPLHQVERGDWPSEHGRLRYALPLLALMWTAIHIVFFADPRFHYPIVLVFALMGAHGAVTVFDAVRARGFSVARRYAQA